MITLESPYQTDVFKLLEDLFAFIIEGKSIGKEILKVKV